MTYVTGFVVAVPTGNEEAYRQHAADFLPLFKECGIERVVENWGDDVPRGKITDFYGAVQAKEDETIVFSWFEYPDKAARDSSNEKMMNDPRMQPGEPMPFDAKRMIYGGFEAIVDEKAEGTTGYTDGYLVPVPSDKREAYRELAQKMAGKFRELGALRVVEAWGDDLPDGKVTDFRRAVKAEEGENVVYSYVEWPDKEVRDQAWQKMMADPDVQPGGDMPFDGKRMFWGGFRPIVDQ
ncbi:MAG: DUF1428 domain-containing protein [Alphaproteobacteria bacterium]|nr:MAG: DUF1428 domain-containing protein [Alphaproteobacteria bacterium]